MAARKSYCQVNYYIQRFRYAALGRWAVSIRTYLLIFPFGYLVTTERELIFNEVGLSRAALIALAIAVGATISSRVRDKADSLDLG